MRSDHLAGVTVTIREDGQELREYEAEELTSDAENTTTAYIESLPGAAFSVEVAFDDVYPYHGQDVYVRLGLDGARTSSQTYYKNKIRNISFRGLHKGYGNETTFHKLTFADLNTTEGPADASKKDEYAKIGDIDVRVYRCHIVEVAPQKKPQLKGLAAPATKRHEPKLQSVPEKALKGRAMSAHATLGKGEPARPRQPSKNTKSTEVARKTLLATYTFKCRSRKDLQIDGLIDRSPSPLPIEERDVEDLSPGELRELVRRQREHAKEQAVKLEKVKRERSTTVISGGEVIDGVDDIAESAGPDSRHKRPRLDSEAVEMIDLSGA